METKFLLLVACFALAESANALKCYTCLSLSPNQTCFSPLNTTKIPSQSCNKTSVDLSIFLNTSHINQIYLQEAQNATEFECVTYKRHYHEPNITEMGRGCFPKTQNVNACQLLYMVRGGTPYNLTKCDICDHDNCNSSESAMKTSGILCLLFLILRNYL